MPAFVALLINHRPKSLRGRSLMEVMETAAAPAGAAVGAVPALARQPVGYVSRVPVAGVCRDRTGALGRTDQPRGRKQTALQAAHVLGAARHA